MLEPRTLSVVGVLIAVAAFFIIRIQVRKPSRPDRAPESTQLRTLALERADYTIHIGMPAAAPTHWQTVEHVSDESLTLSDGTAVSYSHVHAFVVVYPNGQLVEYESHGLPGQSHVGCVFS